MVGVDNLIRFSDGNYRVNMTYTSISQQLSCTCIPSMGSASLLLAKNPISAVMGRNLALSSIHSVMATSILPSKIVVMP